MFLRQKCKDKYSNRRKYSNRWLDISVLCRCCTRTMVTGSQRQLGATSKTNNTPRTNPMQCFGKPFCRHPYHPHHRSSNVTRITRTSAIDLTTSNSRTDLRRGRAPRTHAIRSDRDYVAQWMYQVASVVVARQHRDDLEHEVDLGTATLVEVIGRLRGCAARLIRLMCDGRVESVPGAVDPSCVFARARVRARDVGCRLRPVPNGCCGCL